MAPARDNPGYSVDLPQLDAVTLQLDQALADLNMAASQYEANVCYNHELFGSDVASAWYGFDDAWGLEFIVDSQALAELRDKVRFSTIGYQAAESANSGLTPGADH